MKLLKCPINGVRPIAEFIFGGEYRDMPNPETCTDKEWAAYVFYRNGAPSIKKEWWFHSPSGTWFIAERNTGNDQVISTYILNQHNKVSSDE